MTMVTTATLASTYSGDRSEGEASVAATEQFDYQSDSDGTGADDGVFQLDVGVPRYSPSYLSVKALVVVGSNQETDARRVVFLCSLRWRPVFSPCYIKVWTNRARHGQSSCRAMWPRKRPRSDPPAPGSMSHCAWIVAV